MTKRLVLIGGGHAHVHVLDAFARQSISANITLVSPHAQQVYSGMLPGWIAGHYTIEDCRIPLAPLAAAANARWIAQSVVAIDPVRRTVRCDNGDMLTYDVASIDVGSAPNHGGIAGAADYAVGIRPWPNFVQAIAQWKQQCSDRSHEGRATVVVGGGAGGTEIALALAHFAYRAGSNQRITLVSAGSNLPSGVSRRIASALPRAGVTPFTGVAAIAVDQDSVTLADGRRLPSAFTIVAPGAAAHHWLRESGLVCDASGYVLTNTAMQVHGHPGLFAVGDCATIEAHPRPKSGVYAVRAGPPLAENLRRQLDGAPVQPYLPQRRALYLISTGGRHAIGSWGLFSWSGDWVWRWKDRIDRSFIARYTRNLGP